MKSQTPLIWVMGITLIAAFLGILFGKTTLIIPSVILLGIALGLAFSLAMIFLSLRSRNGREASSLSGMAQSFGRSEEHTSELQSLMRISYAVFCLKKKHTIITYTH